MAKKAPIPDYIRCNFDAIVHISELKPNPKNPNKHSSEQIQNLSNLLSYQGIRKPLIISKQSGLIVTGHGTLEACLIELPEKGEFKGKKPWELIPISYQDFESEEQEYAHLVADNASGLQSNLDYSVINTEVPNLGPNFDMSLLGIRNFTVDFSEKFDPSSEWKEMPEFAHEDKTSAYRIIVHFKTKEDLDSFAALINQNLTEKTRSIWHPKALIDRAFDKSYEQQQS